MDDPPAFGHCRCHEVEPATHDPVPRPKRLLDSAEQAQVLQSAKKLSGTAVGQIRQEELTSAKKPGKVIPVPREEEERLTQRMRILEAELEQKRPLYPERAHPCEENRSFYSRAGAELVERPVPHLPACDTNRRLLSSRTTSANMQQ
nr:uncharacterized protein LOC110356502 isoform X4 [Columba livia]